ncbi:MAG: sugar isomerase [Gemmatimonadota bacterium]|nr:MAG: sugar isomerase [Gemmatimonadota bacterium]
MIESERIQQSNQASLATHREDVEHLTTQLAGRKLDFEQVVEQIRTFEVAIPSWSLGTGGTRFGRFPGLGEPRDVYEKLEDISVVSRLTRGAPRVSLHIPWDEPDDAQALVDRAGELGLGFDAVNSNTFQDQAGQALSYKFGSLSHTDAAVREQAIAHNLHVIEIGRRLGSKAITIWLADGSNYPGQTHLRHSFERVLASLQTIYSHLPESWRLLTEHKPYEPAFYSTVVQDWGSSLMLAQALGERASCLVDLGHHLPNTNVEMVVARLITAGKLGGFHFNDAKYGDDDLTTGSIRPYQLFLIFNELVDAKLELGADFKPAYMIDQSHNVKDPIEALLQSVVALQNAYARALVVDRARLSEFQQANDVMMAERALTEAYETDVRPLAAEARLRGGGALDPVRAFRDSRYREAVARDRASGAYVPPQSL